MATYRKFLEVRGLGKTFSSDKGPKRVLDDVTFDLSLSDSLAIVGPSGCGKTTLILTIAGLLATAEGSVIFQDRTVTGPNKGIALVLQEYGLFPWKTVESNITLGARIQGIGVTSEKYDAIKKELDIEGLDHLYPAQLSGGQRQRVALARALLTSPLLLLLDEPFAAIDTVTRERLQNQLLGAFRQREFSFIIVTHNIEEAVFLGKKIIVLTGGSPSIGALIDNPGMGDMDYRNQASFFELSLKLRRILEQVE